jgi:hypothetical protein
MFEFEDLFIKMLLEYLIIKNGKVKNNGQRQILDVFEG